MAAPLRFPRKAWLVGMVLGVALVALGVSAAGAFLLTGPQRRAVPAFPSDFGYAHTAVTFPAADGVTLAGWFIAAPASRRGVVLLHGNGSTRGQMLGRARLLRSWGYAVLLYDARAHGQSEGRLVSVGWHEQHDLLGALAFLRAQGCTEFGCVGASQGGATVALAAAELADVRWVVLESVYPDIKTALDRRFRRTVRLSGALAGCLLMPIAERRLGVKAEAIAPVRTIAALRCPVLIASGARDEHTTPADTLALYQAAAEPKQLWLVPGAAHVDLYGFAGADYEKHLRQLVHTVWPPIDA